VASVRSVPEIVSPSAQRSGRASVLRRLKNDVEYRRAFLLRLTWIAEVGIGLPLLFVFAPRFHGDIPLFLLLLALNLAAERMPISIYGDSVITVGFVFTLAIIGAQSVTGPPVPAIGSMPTTSQPSAGAASWAPFEMFEL